MWPRATYTSIEGHVLASPPVRHHMSLKAESGGQGPMSDCWAMQEEEKEEWNDDEEEVVIIKH
jgi:hypothetical protein